MKGFVNNLFRIAKEIEKIDPILAYDFNKHIRNIVSSDENYVLELKPGEKLFTHSRDKLQLIRNRNGGWDLYRTNTDGEGDVSNIGWRLKPSDVLKYFDQLVKPGPMTDEIKFMLQSEVESGDEGIPVNDTDLPLKSIEPPKDFKGTVEQDPKPWEKGFSIWDTDLASQNFRH